MRNEKDWSNCKFEDILNIISGKNQKKVNNPQGQYPIYGSGGIIGLADDYLCEPETTIIGRKGTINSPIFVKQKFWNVDTAFGLSPYAVLDNKLLYFFCLQFNFKKLDKSTAVPSLAKRDLLQINFPLPPLPEQRAIVSKIEQLFSELDNAIDNLKTSQKQLKVYRQAVLKKAFEGGFVDLSKSKLRRIDEISEVVRGGSPRPAGDKRFYDGEIPFLKVKDITRNEGPYLKSFEYSIKEAGLRKTRLVEANTLLLSNSGATLGVPTICTFRTTFNDGVAAFLNLTSNNLLYHYYYWLSKTEYLRNINQGAGQPNLNTSMIGKMEIPVYSKDDENAIVQEIESRLSVCDKVEQTIQESLEKAEALRQSILKKAFEGTLLTEQELIECKQQVDWEPASQLLERINKEKLLKK